MWFVGRKFSGVISLDAKVLDMCGHYSVGVLLFPVEGSKCNHFRLHRMHEMKTGAADVPPVCLSRHFTRLCCAENG